MLGVTLARGGSKRVPGKNIRPLNGIPLIAYTVREALESQKLDEYLISTDSPEIQALVTRLGASAPFLRPKHLASDSASSSAALQHAVAWFEKETGKHVDAVVELMATNPFKTALDIDSCVNELFSSQADSVIAVHELGDAHPARIKSIETGFIRDFCLPEPLEARRQDLKPSPYIRSGAIYAIARDELMVHGRRYGSDNSRPYILPPERAVNVDTELDWLLAEILMSRQHG